MKHTESRVKVLKVVGLGRSGSTLLDVVLGNHPEIESVGEVGRLFRTGWIGHEALVGIDPKKLRPLLCTCGKRLDVLDSGDSTEECPFWSDVRREWVRRADRVSIESYPRLQDTFEQERRWPRLLYERHRPSAEFREYAKLTLAFLESVRAVSGKPFVLDSSTVPVQAYVLGMIPGVDLYLIHLVRDGRAAIASHRKPFKRYTPAGFTWDYRGHPIWRTVLRWTVRNLESELVCARLGPKKAMRLRYEDFVADPASALQRIGSMLDLDLTGIGKAAASGEPMYAGHNVGGNATKESGTVTLRPDSAEWRSVLTTAQQRVSWILLGGMMRRYGYIR